MYHRMRRKSHWEVICGAILIQYLSALTNAKHIKTTEKNNYLQNKDVFDNNIIDFHNEYDIKFNKKFGVDPSWTVGDEFNKESHRYMLIKDNLDNKFNTSTTRKPNEKRDNETSKAQNGEEARTSTELVKLTTEMDFRIMPIELISTTENVLLGIVESTAEPDLTVIPLSTTTIKQQYIQIEESATFPTSTEVSDNSTTTAESTDDETTTISYEETIDGNDTTIKELTNRKYKVKTNNEEIKQITADRSYNIEDESSEEERVPIFTELDVDDSSEVPDDYYDNKDIVPTKMNTDALSVLFGLAGGVVESMIGSVVDKVVPKGLTDLFKRMQKQSEALEAEKLRSREENGGLGQFGRGILKSISEALSKQLAGGARDIGSLDNDRSFVSSLMSGVNSVANVATSLVDTFKDKVQAIFPGTVWCGDGRSAEARSGDLGLFFFTDSCCRQHDACKIYIRAGETKYGLTNTGLFTRSHCGCDALFRECLKRTNSLVSTQIGLTYFNVLGPQCFRRAHPILRCVKRTGLTSLKCEEYELDYTKPKMWQWFDNLTF